MSRGLGVREYLRQQVGVTMTAVTCAALVLAGLSATTMAPAAAAAAAVAAASAPVEAQAADSEPVPPQPIVDIQETFTGSGPLGTTQVGGKSWMYFNSSAASWSRAALGYGVAATTAPVSGSPMAVVDTGVSDGELMTKMGPQGGGTSVYFRVADGNNWLRLQLVESITYAFWTGAEIRDYNGRLERMSNGSLSTLATLNFGSTRPDWLSVSASGSQVTAMGKIYSSSTPVTATVTEGFNQSSTLWGVGYAAGSTNTPGNTINDMWFYGPAAVTTVTGRWTTPISATGPQTLELGWSEVPRADYFRVWRSQDAGATWQQLVQLPNQTNVWPDTGASHNSRYFFQTLRGSWSSPGPTASSSGPNVWADKPNMARKPAISFTARVGATISADVGIWTPTPTSYSYQWLRCGAAGSTCVPIAGATGANYVPTVDDGWLTLRVRVTATNGVGSNSADSDPTNTVDDRPRVAVSPAVTGPSSVGGILTATKGTWTGWPSKYAYQWVRCDSNSDGCTPISGATQTTYTATTADKDHRLRIRVTADNGVGTTPADSDATPAIAGEPTSLTPPVISGPTVVGSTLTVSNGTWTASPTSYTYQWRRCDTAGANCATISGATTSTHVTTAGDVGFRMRAIVTASNAIGATAAASNASTLVVNASTSTLPQGIADLRDSFAGTGALGSTEVGGKPWTFLNSTAADWSRAGLGYGVAATSAPVSGSPMAVVDTGVSDGELMTKMGGLGGGTSIYFRVADGNNWLRLQLVESITYAFWTGAEIREYSGRLERMSNGSLSTLATLNFGSSIPGWLSVSASGSQITAVGKSNDSSSPVTATVTEGFNQSSTLWGVGYASGSTNTPGNTINDMWFYGPTAVTTVAGRWTSPISTTEQQSLEFTWTQVPRADYFIVWRSQNAGATWQDLGHVENLPSVSWTDSGASHSSRYVFQTVRGGWTSPAPTASSSGPNAWADKPNSARKPAISFRARVGSTISADVGIWTPTPTSYGYQWLRCDAAGNSCVPIAGATGVDYVPTVADAWLKLRLRVTATNAVGSTSADSDPTETVEDRPRIALTPSVSGSFFTDTVLTATTGTWAGWPIRYFYQWLRCDSNGDGCNAIADATQTTYTATGADRGQKLRVRVTADNGVGTTSADSDATPAISGAPTSLTPPVISGPTVVGSTLTVSNGTWTGTPTSYTYQWQRCDTAGANCTSISGATTNTYVSTVGDIGSRIRAAATAVNADGTATATSIATAAVAAPPTLLVEPAITGTATTGSTLTASAGAWTGNPTSYSYQWMRCDSEAANCVSIAGAQAPTYVPVDGDAGARLRARVTATNEAGGTSASSAATAAITVPIVWTGFRPLTEPTIAGTATVGSTLSVSTGTWSEAPTSLNYQWLRCDSDGIDCGNIAGETASTYVISRDDVGFRLRGQVTAVSLSGVAANRSLPTSAIVGDFDGTVDPTWQALNGTWTQNEDGTATTGAGSAANPMLVTDVGAADVDASVATTDSSGEAIYFRVQDASNWLRVRLDRGDRYQLVLEKSVSGSITQLQQWDAGSQPVPEFRVTAEGSAINIYAGANDGTLVGSFNETAFVAQTRHGCGLGGADTLDPAHALAACKTVSARSGVTDCGFFACTHYFTRTQTNALWSKLEPYQSRTPAYIAAAFTLACAPFGPGAGLCTAAGIIGGATIIDNLNYAYQHYQCFTVHYLVFPVTAVTSVGHRSDSNCKLN